MSAKGSDQDEPVGKQAPAAMPVIEEELHVAKREVDRGGWRLVKQVETRDERVDQSLRSEHVQIERRAIGRRLDGMEAPPRVRQDGDTLIVPVLEEVLVTEKRLVLVEEIRITRIATTRHETQTVVLRKEDIQIERLDAELASDGRASAPPTL